jgi:N-acetylglutamate synthase-like GNAT family acetyltransferase
MPHDGTLSRFPERLLFLARAVRLDAVYLPMTTAQAYFEKRGFRQIGRLEVPAEVLASVGFAGACPASAVRMFRKFP